MSDNYLFDITADGDIARIHELLSWLLWDETHRGGMVTYRTATHYAHMPAPPKRIQLSGRGAAADLDEAAEKAAKPGAWEAGHEPSVRTQILAFFWTDPQKVGDLPAAPLPTAAGPSILAEIIAGWLTHVEYPPEPDHDGSNSKGWRIYNEAWGHVAGSAAGLFAVEPRWQMHGK